jgi:hypothetical protein
MMMIIEIRKKLKEKKDKIKLKMMKQNQYKMIINPIEKNQKVGRKLQHQIMKMIMIFHHHQLLQKKLNKVKDFLRIILLLI